MDKCKEHSSVSCLICPRYEVTWEQWDGKVNHFGFWVGQDAGASWGPMGMEDWITLKYIEGIKDG